MNQVKRENINYASLKPSAHIDLSDSSDEDVSSETIAWRMPRRIFQPEDRSVCVQSTSQNHLKQPKQQPQQQLSSQYQPVSPDTPAGTQAFSPQFNQLSQFQYAAAQQSPYNNQMIMQPTILIIPPYGNFFNEVQTNQAFPLPQGFSPSGPQFKQQQPSQNYNLPEERHPLGNQAPQARNYSRRDENISQGNEKHAAAATHTAKDQRYERAGPNGTNNLRKFEDRRQSSNQQSHGAAFSTYNHSRNNSFNCDDKSRDARSNPFQHEFTENRRRPTRFNSVITQAGNSQQISRDFPSSTETTRSASMPGINAPATSNNISQETSNKKPYQSRDPRILKQNEESTKKQDVLTYKEYRLKKQLQTNRNDREPSQTTARKRALQHESTEDDSSTKWHKQENGKKQSNNLQRNTQESSSSYSMSSPEPFNKVQNNGKVNDVTEGSTFIASAETISQNDKEKVVIETSKVTASETISDYHDDVPSNSTNDRLLENDNGNVLASKGTVETAPELVPDKSVPESAPGQSQQNANHELISTDNIKKESELNNSMSFEFSEPVSIQVKKKIKAEQSDSETESEPDREIPTISGSPSGSPEHANADRLNDLGQEVAQSTNFTEITVKSEKEKVKIENGDSETESEMDGDADTVCSSPENLVNERLNDFDSDPHETLSQTENIEKVKEEVNPEEEAKEDEADSNRRMIRVRPMCFLQGKTYL